jgi:hypothetical protein
LKKYALNNITDFTDAGFLSKIFTNEVSDWLRFYQVKLHDIKTLRKDSAIKHGKEKLFIDWSQLPHSTKMLSMVPCLPNDTVNAKRVITFSLKELRKEPNVNVTNTTLDFIKNTSCTYNLEKYTANKISVLFKSDVESVEANPIKDFLNMISHECGQYPAI